MDFKTFENTNAERVEIGEAPAANPAILHRAL